MKMRKVNEVEIKLLLTENRNFNYMVDCVGNSVVRNTLIHVITVTGNVVDHQDLSSHPYSWNTT